MIERRPRAPVRRAMALRAIEWSASSWKRSLTPSISNMRWYCLASAFFGRVAERRQDGQTADEFRDQAELEQVFGFHLAEHFAGAAFVRGADIGAEAHGRAMGTAGDD